MNKKLFMITVSLLSLFFLTAQTCTWGYNTLGDETQCIASDQFVCEDGVASLCIYSGFGFYSDIIYSTEVSDLPPEVQDEYYACTGEDVVVEEETPPEEVEAVPPESVEIPECGTLCDDIVTQIVLLQENIDTAQVTTTTIQETYTDASTEKIVEQIQGAEVVQRALDAIGTDLNNIGADLALLDAGYPADVAEIENSVLADAQASLDMAQTDLTRVMDLMEAELNLRWVPVRTYEITAASVVRGGTVVSIVLNPFTGTGSETRVPQSDVFFWITSLDLYPLEVIAVLPTSGNFYDTPSDSGDDLFVGGTALYSSTWAGFDSEVLEIEYKTMTGATDTLTVYLPEEDESSLTTNYKMVYYVAADGSTFYIDTEGIPDHVSPPPYESVMIFANLARACEASCT